MKNSNMTDNGILSEKNSWNAEMEKNSKVKFLYRASESVVKSSLRSLINEDFKG